MARIPDIKRIQKENFDKDDQRLAEQIAYPINSFMEQTRSALEGRLDFTNLNQELITLTVTVDADGVPIVTTKWKSNLKSNVAGNVVISAANQTDTSAFPDGCPFISYSQNGGIITVLNVTGLQANNKYDLVVLSIGK